MSQASVSRIVSIVGRRVSPATAHVLSTSLMPPASAGSPIHIGTPIHGEAPAASSQPDGALGEVEDQVPAAVPGDPGGHGDEVAAAEHRVIDSYPQVSAQLGQQRHRQLRHRQAKLIELPAGTGEEEEEEEVHPVKRPQVLQAAAQQHAHHGTAAHPAVRPQNVAKPGAVKHGRSWFSRHSSEAGRFSPGSIGGFPRHEADVSTADASVSSPITHQSRQTTACRDISPSAADHRPSKVRNSSSPGPSRARTRRLPSGIRRRAPGWSRCR
jgi:hypothetical protein